MAVYRIADDRRPGESKNMAWAGWFLYTAYAPLDSETVLVKVGISSIPYQRLASIYCNCPFPISYAAFTAVGSKRDALAAERAILQSFAEHKTRGEWLKLGCDEATKKRFAAVTATTVTAITKKPVEWRRVKPEQIKAFMTAKIAEHDT